MQVRSAPLLLLACRWLPALAASPERGLAALRLLVLLISLASGGCASLPAALP